MLFMPAGTLLVYEAICTMPIDCCGGIFGEVNLSGIAFCIRSLISYI